ncbi:hypothetical protein AB3X52_02970 [Nocardioides sp. DS6]|uniref:Uncharacterized protein n=1 Tax=Nocardioides eburneus TaxID=3231482 RepID=A0ABV3SUF4_9ACTN
MSPSVAPRTEQKSLTPPPPRRSPVRWAVGALAAAVVVVAAVASVVLWTHEDSKGHPEDDGGLKAAPSSAPSAGASTAPSTGASATAGPGATKPVVLTVVPQRGRCLLPSADRLKASAALAFQGTVAEIDRGDHTAVLDVTRWLYADGFGGTDTVRVDLPAAGTESTPTFKVGHTYLVAATGEGQVMGCGFSGEKSGDLSTLYGRAFV